MCDVCWTVSPRYVFARRLVLRLSFTIGCCLVLLQFWLKSRMHFLVCFLAYLFARFCCFVCALPCRRALWRARARARGDRAVGLCAVLPLFWVSV